MPSLLRQLAGVRFEGGEFLQAIKPNGVENLNAEATANATAAALGQCSVAISTDVDIHVKFDPSAAATSADMMLNKGFYVFVTDDTNKVSVIKKAGQPDGIVSIIKPTELQR